MRANLKCKTMTAATGVLLLAALALSGAVAADTGTDSAHKHVWGENIGWASARAADHDLTIHYAEAAGGWLTGHVWGENIGWIVMGSTGGGPYTNDTGENWGVNLAGDGKLSGYAWGENVGWINFGHAQCDAAINSANGEFSGHAWGENIGWVKFSGSSPDYGMRTLAFDTQPQGTPNYWLDHHGVTEDCDAGDGVSAWRKYVMDTDPKVEGDYLRITAISNAPTATLVSFTPASSRRYYTLTRRESLTEGGWSNVVGNVRIQGTGGEQALTDAEPTGKMFYRINVTVTP